MITAQEKDKIIAILGKHYSNKIIDYLHTKNIKPIKALVFTGNFINQIVNGNYENESIELQILNLLKKEQKKLERLAKKRELLTKNL